MQPGNQNRKVIKPQEKKILSEVMFKYLPYWPVFVILIAMCRPAAGFTCVQLHVFMNPLRQ